MNLLKLNEEFPDEMTCKMHFKALRETNNISCRKCNCPHLKWISSKMAWKCSKCFTQMSLRSGTFLQHSNLPFRVWYLCLTLQLSSKKGMSAKEIQRISGHKRYEPIWLLLQKMRRTMGEILSQFENNNFFENILVSQTPLKTGKGFSKVDVLTSKTFDQQKKSKNRSMIRLKCKHVSSFRFGKWMPQLFITHAKNPDFKKSKGNWISNILSNYIKVNRGIYHQIQNKHVQSYLDEFCFKYNFIFSPQQATDQFLNLSVFFKN
jgi:hypothetical protein